MIDYIYICTFTHRYIHSFKGILLKRTNSADLPTLDCREPAVLECVIMETLLYLLYYHSIFDSWLSV